MAYTIRAYDNEGRKIADLGERGNVASARQAMLDHAGTNDLPAELPWHGPDIGVVEGWFIGSTEYVIGVM